MSMFLIFVLLLVLAGEFVNGWTDAPNAIVTVVSTRVISPRNAVLMGVTLNIVGTLSGTAVAHTIGKDIVNSDAINLHTIAAALMAIVLWGVAAGRLGIPISKSHALVSGLAGAAVATAGPDVLLWGGWQKVFVGLIVSSVFCFCITWCLGKIIQFFFSNSNPNSSKLIFNRLQILSAAFMAFNHGMNDGQKFIGVFTLSLVIGGVLPTFTVPFWVIVLCAMVMGIGTSVGGWRIISTLGEKMVHIESWQGFCAEIGASSMILVASLSGIPLSTTHSISTSLMGIAASRRMSSVRWIYARNIVMAWVFTFPICATLAFLIALMMKFFFPA